MNAFLQRHRTSVMGMLQGFDRLRLRGTLRQLAYVGGMMGYLSSIGVLLKGFKEYALSVTEQIRRTTERVAEAAERPVKYLPSSSVRKEHVAREIARRDGVDEGLICVLTCVEPCWSYQVYRNRETRRLELRGRPSKCLHYYHYWIDPTLGFMHARLQTWFPFTVHICINGREWLARQMDQAGIGYVRRDNCFLQIANVARAQRLMDEQLGVNFRNMLDKLVPRFNPAHRRVFRTSPMSYYWSVEESEWASDVMFRRPALLADLYPRLIRHVMENLGSREVMRFLGRKAPAHGGVNRRFAGEVVSDLRERPEGIRVKHRVNRNSIKMYDKEGSILRVETTINNAADLKVFRPKEGDGRGKKEWRPMRKGIADLHRRAVVSQSANDRYLDSLAAVDETTKFGSLVEKLCQPVRWKGKRVRALNPFSADDARLLETVNRGEFSVNGFRNRDLRVLLYSATPADPAEQRRQSAVVTRKLRLLRAHGLIRKVPKTHRYTLSKKGQTAITALLTARAADTAKLAAAA